MKRVFQSKRAIADELEEKASVNARFDIILDFVNVLDLMNVVAKNDPRILFSRILERHADFDFPVAVRVADFNFHITALNVKIFNLRVEKA